VNRFLPLGAPVSGRGSLVILLAGLVFLPALSPVARACGGWYEEAPPLLPFYLDRQPAKSFGDIYLETTPLPKAPAPDPASVRKIADDVATQPAGDLVRQVDGLLAAARLNYVNGDWCNLLQDVRDALLSGGSKEAVAGYIRWRLDHAEWFNIPRKDPDAYYASEDRKKSVVGGDRALELEKRAAEAPPELQPHWLYLRGALAYRAGEKAESEKWFSRVKDAFAASPRAEFALFMAARCELAQSFADADRSPGYWSLKPEERERLDKEIEESKSRHRAAAEAFFQAYLAKYPSGRLVVDTYGWLGALHTGAEALRDYIRQVDAPDHPEVKKSALFMCEDILADAKADDEIFAIVAENPIVAQGTAYLVLNSSSGPVPDSASPFYTDDDGFRADESAWARKWRQAVLPRLAAAVAARKDLYASAQWSPRYLAMLAQAASAVGHQDDAIKLTDRPAGELDGSDDLLLARAIAFQRAGQPKPAIAAYRRLLEKFPQSPLAKGARLKLALALADGHQAGRAVVELKKLRDQIAAEPERQFSSEIYPPSVEELRMSDSFVHRDISGAEMKQIDQILDALYNFAPTVELAAGLGEPGVPEAFQADLRAILAERLLATEDFAGARKVMTEAAFGQGAAELEKLTGAAGGADRARTRAEAMNALGDAWAAQRGRLLVSPLDTQSAIGIFESRSAQAALRRRENGRALGYTEVDKPLEERDELRHAARWWMRAAREVPGSDLAARARWKALAAMPEIASGSDYAFVRAIETDAAGASKQLYERLRKECPDSVEARKYAAYWSFPMPPLSKGSLFPSFQQANEGRDADAIGAMGYTQLDYQAFPVSRDFVEVDYSDYDSEWNAIRDRILALQKHRIDWDAPQLLREVDELRQQVRKVYRSIGDARYLNLLEDLDAFLREPDLTPEAVQAYVELRLLCNGFPGPSSEMQDAIHQLMDDPALQPHSDYVDFLKAVERGKQTVEISNRDVDKNGEAVAVTSRDYAGQAEELKAFLKRYPKSAKREAAMLVLARALYWQMTPLYLTLDAQDGSSARKVYWREKFDAKRLLAALDDYDKQYPHGRYAAEIRNWRGALAWRMRDWTPALGLTIATFDDAAHPDLQPEAALRLANIFAGLADEHYRSDLIAALRKNPRAVELLQKYLGTIWKNQDHPLRYLDAYLADQLGFPVSPPPPPSES